MNKSQNLDYLYQILSILELIPDEPNMISSTTIHQHLKENGFKITDRTLQRNLKSLVEDERFGIKIEDVSKKPYRFYRSKTTLNKLLTISDPIEALNWILAEEYLQPLLPQIAFSKLENRFKEAKTVMKKHKSNHYSDWKNKIKVLPNGKSLLVPKVPNSIWQSISEALLFNHVIKVSYESRFKNDQKKYNIHPQGLVIRNNAIYLLGMINDFDDIRQFALHRFIKVKVLDEKCRKKKNFNLNDYINSGAFDFPIDDKNVTFKAIINQQIAKHLCEMPIHKNQIIEDYDDKHKIITATIANDKQTQWWIMGFGDQIEVLEPVEWRQAIAKQIENMMKKYL